MVLFWAILPLSGSISAYFLQCFSCDFGNRVTFTKQSSPSSQNRRQIEGPQWLCCNESAPSGCHPFGFGYVGMQPSFEGWRAKRTTNGWPLLGREFFWCKWCNVWLLKNGDVNVNLLFFQVWVFTVWFVSLKFHMLCDTSQLFLALRHERFVDSGDAMNFLFNKLPSLLVCFWLQKCITSLPYLA